MILRRLVGVALGAFMLVLNVERADISCARHANHARAEQSDHAQMNHHQSDAGDSQESARGDDGCQTPTLPACCQAVVSCSVVLALGDMTSGTELAIRHVSLPPTAQTLPLSRVTAPEPPPPKA
ncbi:MAG TPA: hypothetical protein VFT29_05165 [Gemmatimonadaceae bacterium]|nr:hypothetical protein [Gemmatimonadaceae bacterium]